MNLINFLLAGVPMGGGWPVGIYWRSSSYNLVRTTELVIIAILLGPRGEEEGGGGGVANPPLAHRRGLGGGDGKVWGGGQPPVCHRRGEGGGKDFVRGGNILTALSVGWCMCVRLVASYHRHSFPPSVSPAGWW